MELCYLLTGDLAEQRPSHELQVRFALYVLNELPRDGFVLEAAEIRRWLRVAGDEHDFVAAAVGPRTWARRLRSLFHGIPAPSQHA
jgi:hypothetical protein